MVVEAGAVLGGRYRLDRLLATGGMGEIWQACDGLLERAVAVKIPRAEFANDPAFHSRFQAEARHAAALAHPNVATVYDFGTGAEAPYLVMELVEGTSLAELLATGRPLPAERVRRLIREVAAALEVAHAAGVCHRDIKPGNLLLRPDGSVVVTDFGIARAVDSAAVTQVGTLVGTAYYVSPEQVSGAPAGPPSDMYALGVLAYECLTGRRPYEGETLTVLAGHRDAPAPPLPDSVPADLAGTVTALLSKNPSKRPTAADLAHSGAGGVHSRAGLAHSRAGSGSERVLPAAPPTSSALVTHGDLSETRALPVPAGGLLARPPRRDQAATPRPEPGPPPNRSRPNRPGPSRRVPWVVALAAAGVAAVALVFALVGGPKAPSPASRAPRAVGAKTAALRSVPVVGAQLFHPGGSDQDHPGDLALAYDGNPGTAWTTQHYASPTFGNLRPGVGLIFDLGSAVAVRRLEITLTAPGATLEVHSGPSLQAPTVLPPTAAPAALTVTPRGASSRYWLVWISRLPAGGQAGIAEVRFLA